MPDALPAVTVPPSFLNAGRIAASFSTVVPGLTCSSVSTVTSPLRSGGENVYSAEVENAISLMPGVGEVAVIGIPDERWGETVHAIIVPKQGVTLTADDVIAHCRDQIAGYKCPRGVDFRDTPLPLSGAGKVLKRELREPYWKGFTKAVN